jgi:hypothetical protein
MAAAQSWQKTAADIIQRVEGDSLGLVQAADLLMDLFSTAGLVYTMNIPPNQVFLLPGPATHARFPSSVA